MSGSLSDDRDFLSLLERDDLFEFDLATLQGNDKLLVQTVNSVWKISLIDTTSIDDVHIRGLSIQSDSVFFKDRAVTKDKSAVKMPRIVYLGGNLRIYPDDILGRRYWLSSSITFFEVEHI